MLTPKDLMELFGVSNHALRKWRYAKPGSQHYLPAVTDIDNPTKVYYTVDAVKVFLKRNPRYADRVASAFAPSAIHKALLPQATHAHQIQQLRGVQPVELTLGAGLLSLT